MLFGLSILVLLLLTTVEYIVLLSNQVSIDVDDVNDSQDILNGEQKQTACVCAREGHFMTIKGDCS